MRKDIEQLMDYYTSPGSLTLYEMSTDNKWVIDYKAAEEYMLHYSLTKEDYEKTWKSIWGKIFNQVCIGHPKGVFKKDFQVWKLMGGSLFEESEFLSFQKSINSIGDKYIIIIQNVFQDDTPPFRMRFPSDITWKELCSGSFLSKALLEMDFNDYYMFGESGEWGKYSATEAYFPMDYLGVNSSSRSAFQELIEKSKRYIPTQHK